MEEWKSFQDYEISNFGNVKRFNKLLKCSITNRGYKYFQQMKDGKRINHSIHCLVAQLFIGERPNELVIDHIDRDKLNNNVDNLRYITQNENCKNTDWYRSEIEEKDKRLRRNIIGKESYRRNRDPNVIEKRPRGTGQLYQRDTGNWRGVIIINKVKYDKTFKTKEEAETFLKSVHLI